MEQPTQTSVTGTSRPMTQDEIVVMFARRMEAYENLDAAALAADYSDDATINSPVTGTHGKADAERNFRVVFDAFLDLKMTFEPPIVDGMNVALFATAQGTNIGGLMGLAPSGRHFKLTTAFFCELKDGKIVREQRVYDFTGLLVQIGVLKAKPV
jgi:predicted ester cyclase